MREARASLAAESSKTPSKSSQNGGSRRPRIAFSGFVLDTEREFLLHDGEVVPLTPKAFATLATLVDDAGRLCSKDHLLGAVWGADAFVEDSVLTQNIYTLRRTLARYEPDADRFVETVPRRGYRFTSPIRILGREAANQPRTLAVLPFQDLSVLDDGSSLGLTFADALITRLARSRRVIVRSTGAVSGLTGERDPSEVGARLGVEAVVDGTIQRSGDRLRVNVQLVDCQTQAPVWADSYDVALDELLEGQDRIARLVADRLRIELGPRDGERPSRATKDLGAYQAYVKGRFFWNKRTAADLLRALGYFREALSIDPEFAAAHAGLASTLALMPFYGGTGASEAFPEAIREATRALDLDPHLAEAHNALAYARFLFDWDWEESERRFQRAIDLDPGLASAHQWYAFRLAAEGRTAEAVDQAERAVRLDPLSLVVGSDLGLMHYFHRDSGSSVEAFRRVLELESEFPYAHFGLAFALQEAGCPGDALRHARRAADATEAGALWTALGYCAARAGDDATAGHVLAYLDRLGPTLEGHRAIVLTGLGRGAEAMEALERSFVERSRVLVMAPVWPVFDDIRDRPEFEALMDRLRASAPG